MVSSNGFYVSLCHLQGNNLCKTKSRLHLGSKTFETTNVCTIIYKWNNIVLRIDKIKIKNKIK